MHNWSLGRTDDYSHKIIEWNAGEKQPLDGNLGRSDLTMKRQFPHLILKRDVYFLEQSSMNQQKSKDNNYSAICGVSRRCNEMTAW